MKTTLLIILLCMSVPVLAQQSKGEILQEFLGSVIQLNEEILTHSEPIAGVAELAKNTAAKSMEITKENMAAFLTEARNYQNVIIITGRHTIVKITSLDDCVQSGAWGVCMPKGVGYVQQGGELKEMEGFINSIIGVPDAQKRTAFLFN